MFKVGMGESPEMPQDLSEEGMDFVETCLDHDPKERWSAEELLLHNFCKVKTISMFFKLIINFDLLKNLFQVSIENDCSCETEKEAKRTIKTA